MNANKTIKSILVCLFLFCTTWCCMAQTIVTLDSKVKPTKQEKIVMKRVVKESFAKKAVIRQEEDGFRYIFLSSKYGKKGIYSVDGQCILPLKMDKVYYFPRMSEGYSDITCSDQNGKTREYHLYHGNTDASFFCVDGINSMITDISGRVKAEKSDSRFCLFPGYILIGTEDLATMVTTLVEYKTEIVNLFATAYYSNLSLYSTDGKVIVNGAEKILFPNKKNLKDNHIVYEKRNAGIIQKGGLLLDNLSDSVPCLFSDISYHYPKDSSEKAYWSIKRSKNSDDEVYDKNRNYNVLYRDKGEELFEKGNYEGVINFYAKEGISAPWAKFFTGRSLFELGVKEVAHIDLCTEYLNENRELLANSLAFDLKLAQKQFELSKQILNAYLKEDSLYKGKAKLYLSIIDMNISELPQKELAYQNAIKNLEKRKEQAKLAQIQREREIQQRKNEQSSQIMMAILGGFAKALLSGGNTTQQTYRNSGSVSSGNVSSGNSSSKNDKYRQEWLQRKRNAEKQLNYYQEQLKKDPNNAALKHNIRKQQEIIRNAESML